MNNLSKLKDEAKRLSEDVKQHHASVKELKARMTNTSQFEKEDLIEIINTLLELNIDLSDISLRFQGVLLCLLKE